MDTVLKESVHALRSLLVAACLVVTLPAGDAGAAQTDALAGFVEHRSAVPVPDMPFIGPDGRSIKFADFRGQLLLVNFWATWCAPCIHELPSLAALRAAIADPRFDIMLVSIDRGAEAATVPFLERMGIDSLISAHDPRGALMRALEVRGVPTTLLIGPDGARIGQLVGPADWGSPEAVALIGSYLTGG